MGDHNKRAMDSVLEDMGRAARQGRARRFAGKPPRPTLEIGEVTLEPNQQQPDLSDQDLKDLEDLEIQRSK